MNGITYYQTRSPYRGDFTKNCSLNGFEIDSNFLNLEGRDIRRMYTRGCTLYAELYNGETISTTIDSCGGGSGSGSCDCEREINYLEGERDVVVEYQYVIDNEDIQFEILIPCRLNTSGLTNIGEATSHQISNLVFTPIVDEDEEYSEDEVYNSFEISGTYNNGGQNIPIHIYTQGSLFRQGIYNDSGFHTRIGTCTIYTIRGTYNGTLESDKENLFRFSISQHDSEIQMVFNEFARFNFSDGFEIMGSTDNYIILALSDYFGNVINSCMLMEGNSFQIGIFWTDDMVSQELDLMKRITWSELKELRDNSQLVPGMQYRITDYDCMTIQTDTDSAHHPFDIIVFADDEHTLNEDARAAKRGIYQTLNFQYEVRTDTFFNVNDNNDKYDVGNYNSTNTSMFLDTNGQQYFRLNKVQNNHINDLYYTTVTPVNSTRFLYDRNFNLITSPDVVSLTYKSETTLKWKGDATATRIGTYTYNNNIYTKWRIDSWGFDYSGCYPDDIFGLSTMGYVYSDGDNNLYYGLDNELVRFSTLFTDLDLVGQDNILGKFREFTYSLTINDETSYFDNCNLEAWELKYCLDNDTNRFAWAVEGYHYHLIDIKDNLHSTTFRTTAETETYWAVYDVNNSSQTGYFKIEDCVVGSEHVRLYADTSFDSDSGYLGDGSVTGIQEYYQANGKGVIYYMKDDRNNELPYDFKNIMFKRTIDGSDVMLYTFTQTIGGTISDASVYKNSALKEGVFENIITPYYTEYNNSVRRSLNQNVFYSSGILFAHSNTFGVNCYSNVFGDACLSNVFGDYCYSNTFGNGCSSNTFGIDCSSNTFDDNCLSNVFSDNCYFNVLGNNCYSNVFGDACLSNVFGDNCYFNVFGNNCHYNTFGEACLSNVFGDNCSHISIKDSNQNTIDNIRFIHVFNNVANRNIYTDFQGNYLAQDATYTQYVAENRDGNLVIWNPADLALPPQQP